MRRRLAVILLTTLLLLLGTGATAMAHATLIQALPVPDGVLKQAPRQVALQFNEEVEAQFGAIAVYDHTGARVDKGDAALDPTDVTRVIASLKPISDGLFTVSYRVLSADGHPIAGQYGFTVGKGIDGAKYYQPSVPDTSGRPPAGVLLGYWLTVIGLMALAGMSVVQGLVVREPGGAALRRALWLAWGAALAGSVILLVSRTAQAADITLLDALNPSLLWRLLMTRTGLALLARFGLLAVTAVLLGAGARRWWLGAGLGALGLVTVAMGGHAVAVQPPALTVTLDALHLLAGSVWLGGLLQFAFLLRTELADRVRRFSSLAAICIVVLVGTGLYPALLHIPSQKALFQTTYGVAFLVKLSLIALLLPLGAANLLIVGPALRKGNRVSRWLRWLVGVEVTLMACVLGVTALLTNVAPARAALPPEKLFVNMHTNDYATMWTINPLATGYRTITVTVGAHEGLLEPETKVRLELIHKEHAMGPNITEGQVGGYVAQGAGVVYRFDQVLIGMPGQWQFVLHIERPGKPPAQVKINVTVPDPL